MNKETEAKISVCYGRTICDISLGEHYLNISFTDGSKVVFWDEASYCYEYRYLHTEAKLTDLLNQTIVKIEVVSAPVEDEEGAGFYKDVCFLKIQTNKDSATINCYNEHNGYYAGFELYFKFDSGKAVIEAAL